MPLPTVIVPGYLESAIAYRQLEQSLQQLDFPTLPPTRTIPTTVRFSDGYSPTTTARLATHDWRKTHNANSATTRSYDQEHIAAT